MGSFYSKEKMYSLKLTEKICVITIKSDAKFEKELTCCFKIDMRDFTNFDPTT